ncbi:unnamed protein product [Rotaria magnacalcarata]|uniref:BZIP domain-containing protein n=1 Tax=Rotaria magnacalcarata TaxID=392030 RepID=A0A819KB57_9BILA|nr:unnamed protein product [Rotaria magnacalcarata]CAF1569503.1 unnamed protein product [Rotaria magnacalcarata]CAF2073282.1 unnamed protein product [Rotaria magnacalcarata]CAF2225795.1 unnamed protein product [Rotaria magnacalcarata]CAF2266375.1 unnamed protein product [Rotaria magnacalcarata]
MSSSPSVINNHLYHGTTSSLSPSCSSSDISQDEYILLNTQFSQNDKQDASYPSQRSRNNFSSKRTRVKRRMNDFVLENKLTKLTNENEILRAKISMLTRKFGHLTNDKDESLFEYDGLTSTQQPTVLNILDQSSTQINHSDNNLSLTTTKEQLTLEKCSMPIKWRFKMFNIKSDF